MSAQTQRVQDTAFRSHSSLYSSGSQAVRAQSQTQPLAPETLPSRKKTRELSPRIKAREAAHRSVIQHTVGVLSVAGIIGIAFLGGHMQLAYEAHRSATVSQRLNQAVEMSHYWQNRHAKTITPAAINQRASAAGMERPDEHDTIMMP